MRKIISAFALLLLCAVSAFSQQIQTLQETDSLGVRRQKTNANFSLLNSLLASKVEFPVLDTTTLLKDDADQTKTIRFELSGLSTDTLRIVNWPDLDLTVAGIDVSQSWTGKPLFGAGINIVPAADNPSSPGDGDIAYNSTDNKFKFRENGAWVEYVTASEAGDNISVNGTAAIDADFDDATPSAPSNGINVVWQKDTSAPDNISAHILTTDIGSTTFGSGSGFTWTFNAGGTPSQITFGSATVNVAVGALQQGGVNVVTVSGSQSLSDKTLVLPVIASFASATHDHDDAAGGGQLNASNVFSTGTVPVARLPLMVGDSGSGGTAGLVPAPGAGDAAGGKFLKADGSWAVPPTAGSPAWGDIIGTLSNQSDLQSALNGKQSSDNELDAFAGVTSAADKLFYFTGSGTGALTDFTSFARTLLDDTTSTTARATLGLVIGTNVQAFDSELAALASVTSAADKLFYFTGSGTGSTTDLTSFARTLLDDTTSTAARSTLGVVIGTDVQGFDSDLSALAGNSTNGLWTRTGSGTGAARTVTGGVGVDVSNGDGVSGNPTITWNPSTFVNSISLWNAGNASRTLTANLSGATDPVITFANNLVDITTGLFSIGGGTGIQQVLSATATIDFEGALKNNCSPGVTMTVTGAAVGDSVFIGVPAGSVPEVNSVFNAYVSAANTVTVKHCNIGGSASSDPASGTFRAVVFKF